MIPTSDKDFDPQSQNLALDRIKTGIMSEQKPKDQTNSSKKDYSPNVKSSGHQTNQTMFEHANSDYGALSTSKQQTPPDVITGQPLQVQLNSRVSSRVDRLSFNGFSVNNVVKYKNNSRRRVIKGTSGLAVGSVIDCDTSHKLGLQVCQNLMGRVPNSVKSDQTQVTRQYEHRFTSNLASPSLAFEKRSEKSKLFACTLNTIGDFNLSSFKQPQNQVTQSVVYSHFRSPVSTQSHFMDYGSDQQIQQPQGLIVSPRARTTGIHQRLHSNQQLRQLRDRVTTQAANSFEKQVQRQNDQEWTHKTPLLQCAIQFNEKKEGISRLKIVQKISQAKKPIEQHAPEEKVFVEKRLDTFQRPSNVQGRKFHSVERQIEESANMIEARAMLSNKEELRLYLRGAHQPKVNKAILTSQLYNSATHKQKLQQEEQKDFVPLSVRFAKAFGTLFQQNQMIKIQDIQEKERLLKKSMEDFAKTRISATTAVQNLTQDKQEQIMLLFNRDRYWSDHDQEKQQELVNLVGKYCDQIYEQQNEASFNLLAFDKQLSNSLETSPVRMASQISFVGSLSQLKQTQLRKDLISLSPKQRAREGLKRKVQRQITGKVSQGLAKFDEAYNVDLFSTFLEQRKTTMSIPNQTNCVIDKLYFQQIGKKLQESHLHEDNAFQKEAKIQFYEMCNEFKEPTIDILNHIQNQSLALQNYRMNPGQCQGIQRACAADDELLQNLVIDNCGLEDGSLAQIIDGLNNQRRVNQVLLRKTVIGHETADKIANLLSRELPYNVVELRIETCDVKNDALNTILSALLMNFQLNKLVLIGLSLNEQHLKLLERFLTGAKYLVNLDLSWNRFKLQSFLPLFTTICANKRLQNLNLSWNSLVEYSNLGVVGSLCDDEKELSQRKTNQKRKQPEVKKLNKKLAEILGEDQIRRKEFNQLEKIVVDGLQQFLSQNKKLMHLDLSDTGLSEDMILEIIKGVKFCQSLIGLHLSGNPGLSLAVEAKILSRMDATYERPLKLTSFFQHINNIESPDPPLSNNKSLLETVFVKQIKQNRQAYYPTNVGKLDDAQRRHLILTRKLGHRTDIPGGSEWRAFTNSQDECYICDRKIYSLFVWSPEIGIIGDTQINLTDAQKRKIAKYILMNRETNLKREQQVQIDDELVNEKHLPQRFDAKKSGQFDLNASSDESQDLSEDESSNSPISGDSTPLGKTVSKIAKKLSSKLKLQLQNIQIQKQNTLVFDQKKKIRGHQVPLLYGGFNNWQAQPMIKVSHLAEYLLKETPPDILQKMKEEGLCSGNAKFEDLTDRQLSIYNSEFSNYKDKFQDFSVWSRVLQNMIPYKQLHISGVEEMQMVEPKEVYISANFISSGKQNYAVTYDNQIYLHKTIADFRREEIVLPKLGGEEVGKVERNPNVFKNFVVDNSAIYENCSKYDFEGWKLGRFVKDANDQAEIRRIIKREYAYMKDLFMHLASLSNYPGLSCLDFTTFIEHLEIVGGPVSIGIIETQFIAARTDVENRGMKTYGQQSLDINRFEFFEALVRVAGCVYKQQGFAASWNEAFSKIVQRIKEKFQFDTQQEFRDKLLYTREVNLTLDANKEGLLDVYNIYVSKKQQRVSMQSCVQLLTRDTSIKLQERDAVACYGLCQMTCPDLVKNSFLYVGHITFIEFLELVGRVADCYFQDLDAPLEVKINYVLDAWLQLVNKQREDSQYFEEGVFDQSDEEADSMAQKKLLRLRLSKKLDQTILDV